MAQDYKESGSEVNGIYTFICEGMVLGNLIQYKSEVAIAPMEYDMRLKAIERNKSIEESVDLLNEIPKRIQSIKNEIRWQTKKQFLDREDLIHTHNESKK